MLFFQIRNIAPMIRCRIFIRLKQRNNQFVVFYFGYLFSDFCRLAHGCIQIRPRRCVNHVFGLIFVIDQPDFFILQILKLIYFCIEFDERINIFGHSFNNPPVTAGQRIIRADMRRIFLDVLRFGQGITHDFFYLNPRNFMQPVHIHFMRRYAPNFAVIRNQIFITNFVSQFPTYPFLIILRLRFAHRFTVTDY